MTYASRFLLAALLLPLSLSGCDWFDKKKPPLVGERIPVFSDRKELEPDKDAGAIAEELYLSVLSRRPAPQEQKVIGDFLSRHEADRATALPELAWALLSAAEFRFNH